MQTLVIYDIPDDKIRNKISEACKIMVLPASSTALSWATLTITGVMNFVSDCGAPLGKKRGISRSIPCAIKISS